MVAKPTKTGMLIKRYREANRMTQEELAMKLGFKNKSSVARIENGSVKMARNKILDFSNVLGIDLQELQEAVQYDYIAGSNDKSNVTEIPLPTASYQVGETQIDGIELIKSGIYTLEWDNNGYGKIVPQNNKQIKRIMAYMKLMSEESKELLLKRAEELLLLEKAKKGNLEDDQE